MNKQLTTILLAACLTLGVAHLQAAGSNPAVELAADSIEYDSAQGLATAQGGVRITRDKMVMTGALATYNANTGEIALTGGVKAVREQAVLTAAEIKSVSREHLIATGQVELVNGDQHMTGAQLDYYTDREYAVLSGGARLENKEAVMTAPQLESWISENRAVGTGGVHIISDVHKVDATADEATYTAVQNGQGQIVLSGNAKAVQQGNILTGNKLTIHLGEKATSAQGRTKLVITPQ